MVCFAYCKVFVAEPILKLHINVSIFLCITAANSLYCDIYRHIKEESCIRLYHRLCNLINPLIFFKSARADWQDRNKNTYH